jgi:hypothetical protein
MSEFQLIRSKSGKIYYYKPDRYKDRTPIVEAKCPGCGKIHKVKLDWTGNGIPRIYCEKCLIKITYDEAYFM